MNYNSPIKLNHVTAPEALQLNCDYAVAFVKDRPCYAPYYQELDIDKDWGYCLLKRKHKLQKQILYETVTPINCRGHNEFYNLYEKLDTAFASLNPVMAEVEMNVKHVPIPFIAWLTMEIHGENDHTTLRTPLNMIRQDWNGVKNYKISLTSCTLPKKIKRIVCYLWNIKQSDVQIHFTSFKLYQINGDGVNIICQ